MYLPSLIWHAEVVPANWRRGVIVMLPKKGNNCKGIKLRSIPGKVFWSVLLQHLKDEVDTVLREEQAGWDGPAQNKSSLFTTS